MMVRDLGRLSLTVSQVCDDSHEQSPGSVMWSWIGCCPDLTWRGTVAASCRWQQTTRSPPPWRAVVLSLGVQWPGCTACVSHLQCFQTWDDYPTESYGKTKSNWWTELTSQVEFSVHFVYSLQLTDQTWPTPITVNKVLLGHRHIHLFEYCPWILMSCNGSGITTGSWEDLCLPPDSKLGKSMVLPQRQHPMLREQRSLKIYRFIWKAGLELGAEGMLFHLLVHR